MSLDDPGPRAGHPPSRVPAREVAPRVLVHGATGFTGRLVCDALRRRAIPFAVSGRNRAKLDAIGDRYGLDRADRHVVDLADATSIQRALESRGIVCACAGPFVEVGEPMLASCARLGVHYVDTTGEQPFVALAASRYRATAEASGACVAPAMAYEVAPADWAAHEAARLAGGTPESIEIVYMMWPRAGLMTTTTRGTKRSAIAMLSSDEAKQFVDGALRDEPAGASVKTFVAPNGRPVTAASFPSPEAVFVPSHTGARTVRTYMTVGRNVGRALRATHALLPRIVRAARPLLARAVEGAPEGPMGDARDLAFDVVAEARCGATRARVVVSGTDPYGLTAEIQALAAARAISGAIEARGVVAPNIAIPWEIAMRELAPTGLTMTVGD